MTEPRTEGTAIGPAGSAAGSTAMGSASSGRPGRAYVPAPAAPVAAPTSPPPAVAPPGVTSTMPRVPPRGAQPTTYRPGPEPEGPLRTPPPPPASRTTTVSAATASRPRRGIRRARLRLTHVDPWSALKVSLVFAAFLFVVWMVAVLVLFAVLSGAGVFSSVNSTLTDVFGTHVNFSGFVIVGGAAVIGALSVVIVAALGTVAAVAYNVTAGLLGGLDVTLTESD